MQKRRRKKLPLLFRKTCPFLRVVTPLHTQPGRCFGEGASLLGAPRLPAVLIRHVASLLSSARRGSAASPWWTLRVETQSGHSFQPAPRQPRQLAPACREAAGAMGGKLHPPPGAAISSLPPREVLPLTPESIRLFPGKNLWGLGLRHLSPSLSHVPLELY